MGLYVDSLIEENVRLNASGNRLSIIGSINCSDPGQFMTKFINDFHDNAIKKGIKEVIIDIKELKFLNSSGIKEFVTWILNVASLGDAQKYHLKFLCNKDFAWQETSVATLIILNPDISEIIYDEPGNSSGGGDTGQEAAAKSSAGSEAVFPRSIKCPKCAKVLKTSKAGKFKCPSCSNIISIDNNGNVTA